MKQRSTGTKILYIHFETRHSVVFPNQWVAEPILLVELVLKVNKSHGKGRQHYSRLTRRASYLSVRKYGTDQKGRYPHSPACWGTACSLSDANVPDFICAKIFAGDVFELELLFNGAGDGVDTTLLNGDGPNGEKLVGSTRHC